MTIVFLELFALREKKNLIAFENPQGADRTKREPPEGPTYQTHRASRSETFPSGFFFTTVTRQGYFRPRTDRARHTAEVHVWSLRYWASARLWSFWRARSARHFRFSQFTGPLSVFTPGAVAVLWKSREKLVAEGGEKPTLRTRRTEGASRLFLVGSLGDASVNARAMSRRKQGNPQHLSQREILTRKSIFIYLFVFVVVRSFSAHFFSNRSNDLCVVCVCVCEFMWR